MRIAPSIIKTIDSKYQRSTKICLGNGSILWHRYHLPKELFMLEWDEIFYSTYMQTQQSREKTKESEKSFETNYQNKTWMEGRAWMCMCMEFGLHLVIVLSNLHLRVYAVLQILWLLNSFFKSYKKNSSLKLYQKNSFFKKLNFKNCIPRSFI